MCSGLGGATEPSPGPCGGGGGWAPEGSPPSGTYLPTPSASQTLKWEGAQETGGQRACLIAADRKRCLAGPGRAGPDGWVSRSLLQDPLLALSFESHVTACLFIHHLLSACCLLSTMVHLGTYREQKQTLHPCPDLTAEDMLIDPESRWALPSQTRGAGAREVSSLSVAFATCKGLSSQRLCFLGSSQWSVRIMCPSY